MKRLLSVFAIALMASSVFAQDDFGFGGGTLSQSEIDQLLGGGGGRGGRGRGDNNVQSILPDPAVMFVQLKDLLKNQKVPLAKEQEKPLQTMLNDQTKVILSGLYKQFPPLDPVNQQQQQQQQQQQNNQNRGNQNNQQNNPNNQTVRIDRVILEQNGQLLTEVKAQLAPEQVAVLDKAEKDKKCLVMLDGYFSFLQNNGQRGNGTTNNRTWCTWGDFTANQRLAPVRDLLKKERKPLTTEQDAKLVALIETRLPITEKALRDDGVLTNNNQNRGNQQQNQQNQQQQQQQQLANNIVNNIFTNLGIQNPNNNQGNRGNNNQNFDQIAQQACAPNATPEQQAQAQQQLTQMLTQFEGGRGNRGGGNRGNFSNPDGTINIQQLCQQFGNRGNNNNRNQNVNFNAVRTEVEKQNELLLDKVVAMLKPDQQKIIKRFKYDQIKSKGGAERIRSILEEEGTPLTPEQIPPIQALFNESNQTLRQWAQQLVIAQFQTNPPPFQTQTQTQNQNQGNRGNNNFNNNQGQPNPLQEYQQKMRDQLMPRVQQERQRIENAMMSSVMKLLTPSQVASYKINISMPPL